MVSKPLAVYLDMDDLDPTPGIELLAANGFRVERGSATELAHFPQTVALLVGYDRVDSATLAPLPELAVISTHSAGVDMVDLDQARRAGIWVCNVPSAATEEVAVHALALALAVVRSVPQHDRAVRAGQWLPVSPELLRRPSTMTCGIVGMGRIGRHFAALARPVFGRILASDPLAGPGVWPDGVENASLDELLAASDVVSLHLPLTDQTRHLMDATRLAAMKRSAYLINASRGGLVDEKALLAELERGHLAGAGLDVLSSEPPGKGDPLVGHDRVVVTPHVGYLSAQSRLDYVMVPAGNVVAWHRTGKPSNVVVEGRR